MGELYKRYSATSLILRIIIGLIIGIFLGIIYQVIGGLESSSSFLFSPFFLLGDLFISSLKALAPILVFFLVSSAICMQKKGSGKKLSFVIKLYAIGTLMAAVVAVTFSFMFPVTVSLDGVNDETSYEVMSQTFGQILTEQGTDPNMLVKLSESSTEIATELGLIDTAPETVGEVLGNLLLSIVQNPIAALATGNFISILFWAILLGTTLRIASDGTKKMFSEIANGLSQMVKWVINFAPFGIAGLVFSAVSESGIGIFIEYGQLLAILLASMMVVLFIINPIMGYLTTGKNPFPIIFYTLGKSGLNAFFTRSSAANIPVNLELCEEMDVDKDLYNVSIPLGSTINMSGAAITITIFTLAAANTTGVEVNFFMALVLSVIAAVSAAGASGVAGGSLLLIPVGCSLFGIPTDVAYQMVAIGFTISVIQDSAETALNSSTDAMFTIYADRYIKRKK